jgi:hypothetical protein
MSLFSRRSGLISYTCACCFFQSVSVYGWVYTSTIFYQNYKKLSPLQNSVATLTTMIVGTCAAVSPITRVATTNLTSLDWGDVPRSKSEDTASPRDRRRTHIVRFESEPS